MLEKSKNRQANIPASEKINAEAFMHWDLDPKYTVEAQLSLVF